MMIIENDHLLTGNSLLLQVQGSCNVLFCGSDMLDIPNGCEEYIELLVKNTNNGAKKFCRL